jgi:hypothetical protein
MGHVGGSEGRRVANDCNPEVEPVNLEVEPVNLEVERVNLEVERVNLEVERVNLEVERVNLEVEPVNLEVEPVVELVTVLANPSFSFHKGRATWVLKTVTVRLPSGGPTW